MHRILLHERDFFIFTSIKNRLQVLSILITGLQLIAIGHLYDTWQSSHFHIPTALIELTILAVVNIIFLIIAYFVLPGTSLKQILWKVSGSIAATIIIFTLICYGIMGICKY